MTPAVRKKIIVKMYSGIDASLLTKIMSQAYLFLIAALLCSLKEEWETQLLIKNWLPVGAERKQSAYCQSWILLFLLNAKELTKD